MNRELFDALEASLKLIEAGVTADDCLKEYPDFAPELRKLLETIEVVKDLRVERIPAERMDQNRIKLLAYAESLVLKNIQGYRSSTLILLLNPVKYFMHNLKQLRPVVRRLGVALGLAFIFILLSGGLLVTSAKSLPGDTLYPVKIAIEDIKVYLAPSGEIRHEYEYKYQQQRVDEVVKLIGLMRKQQISFEGIITSVGDSQLSVSGIPVKIQTENTIISGVDNIDALIPGMRIEVEGETSLQGWVLVNEIHLREYQYIGTVDKISQDEWQVSGTPFIITSSTQIDPGIKIGDPVTVFIRSEDNGLFAFGIVNELHPAATPTKVNPTEIIPSANEEPTIQNAEGLSSKGIVELIGRNYWIINGNIFYIVKETDIEESINLGDKIIVLYKIEPKGIFTAIEIKRCDNAEDPDVNNVQEESGRMIDVNEQGSSYEIHTEEHKSDEGSEHHESEGTPEPTEVHNDYH